MRRAARSTALGSAPTASPPRGCFALGRGATHPPAEVLIDYIGSMEKHWPPKRADPPRHVQVPESNLSVSGCMLDQLAMRSSDLTRAGCVTHLVSEPVTYGHPNLGCERLDPGEIGITDSPTDIWPGHGAPEREVSGHTNEGWGSTDTTTSQRPLTDLWCQC